MYRCVPTIASPEARQKYCPRFLSIIVHLTLPRRRREQNNQNINVACPKINSPAGHAARHLASSVQPSHQAPVRGWASEDCEKPQASPPGGGIWGPRTVACTKSKKRRKLTGHPSMLLSGSTLTSSCSVLDSRFTPKFRGGKTKRNLHSMNKNDISSSSMFKAAN